MCNDTTLRFAVFLTVSMLKVSESQHISGNLGSQRAQPDGHGEVAKNKVIQVRDCLSAQCTHVQTKSHPAQSAHDNSVLLNSFLSMCG